ncbi:MAG: permease-like cell division protein FtsX [Muribaculaceae bacterium]|nr:permease-like cell division protein FtsX [Muribaculaceae bacterium]
MKKRSSKISTLGSRATSVVSVTLLSIILGILALTMLSAHRQMESTAMSIYIHIKPGTEQYDIAPLKQILNKAPFAKSYTYTSAEDILAAEINDENRHAIELLGENPYSDEIDIKLNQAYLNPDSLKSINKLLTANAVVENVILPSSEIVNAVDNSINKIVLAVIAIAILMLIISIALINNTVSLSIYSRRFIIHTMKLVGATRGYIRRPFVRAAATAGLIAGIIAGAVVCGTYYYLQSSWPDTVALVSWTDISLIDTALILLSIIVCATTAWCAANRYLNKNYDKLFMK